MQVGVFFLFFLRVVVFECHVDGLFHRKKIYCSGCGHAGFLKGFLSERLFNSSGLSVFKDKLIPQILQLSECPAFLPWWALSLLNYNEDERYSGKSFTANKESVCLS